MRINWKVRFNKNNKTFIARFFVAVFLPVLVYYGLETKDLTTWQSLFDVFLKAISNPYVVGTMVVNAINLIPDPTTKGLGDSSNAMEYTTPKEE